MIYEDFKAAMESAGGHACGWAGILLPPEGEDAEGAVIAVCIPFPSGPLIQTYRWKMARVSDVQAVETAMIKLRAQAAEEIAARTWWVEWEARMRANIAHALTRWRK